MNSNLEAPVFEPLVTITPFSLESGGQSLDNLATATFRTIFAGAWPVANQALFVPFMLSKKVNFLMMFTYNGAVVNGNVDVGIYDENGARIVSIGGVAQAAGIQTFNIADTLVGPGVFYMAQSLDNIVGTAMSETMFANGAPALLGMAQMAAAYPLPAVAVLATITGNFVPMFGVQLRVAI